MNQMLSVREFINLIADGKIEIGERFIFRGSVYTNDGKSIRNEQNIYLKNELFGRFGCSDFTSENPELDEIRAMETYEEIQEMMN
ncbi:hypothetical protein MMJ21_11015 [Enterococcus cecorum]|uniref:hypothetical protein n=1 Tax=Enterococcus cecorum TaxID=44008 RepID=UPI001FAE25A1|nr:hypothetical protein [Enterococcus cecorum]MCJ0522599.1 hypothetical protein [Enterococcus cecorum]MCJ0561022.1 hypothetical protein [Enterococcus cecorum]